MAKQKRSTAVPASTDGLPSTGCPELIRPESIPVNLGFTAARGLYTIAPGAHKSDATEHLTARLSQLCALLMLTAGEGFASFDNLNDDHRENYLWCCAMMATECRTLASMV